LRADTGGGAPCAGPVRHRAGERDSTGGRGLLMAKERLGVVFGGKSVEHEVSVVSAMDLLQYADRDRFDIVPFGVTGEGRWLTPDETRSQLDTPAAAFARRMTGEHPRLLQRPDVMSEIASCDVM